MTAPTATASTPALDLDRIRAEFPALGQSDTVFLDNAGGSQVLRRVADRVSDYLLTTSVQLGASYATSRLAGERVLAARRAMAEMVHAAHDDEVVFGGSTTGLMFLLTDALRHGVKPGDEIIVTDTDHEANIGGWLRLRAAGVVVKVWAVNRETLSLDLADLDALLTERTTWVAITWASNVLGTVNPVAEVARRVHAAGARLCVDAVAYAPHRLLDVQASGADVVVFSVYKVFGPHQAVLWGRRDLLLTLPSLNHWFIGPEVLPYKLQPGNVNFELAYGCLGIHDYLCDVGAWLGGAVAAAGAIAADRTGDASAIAPLVGGGAVGLVRAPSAIANARTHRTSDLSGAASRPGDAPSTPRQHMQAAFDAFAAHEERLTARLLGWLATRPQVRVIGSPTAGEHRMATVSFVVDGRRSEDIVTLVDTHGIGIRWGDFYARRLIDALGLERSHGGVVRVSIAHYNTLDEIDRLIVALDEAIGR